MTQNTTQNAAKISAKANPDNDGRGADGRDAHVSGARNLAVADPAPADPDVAGPALSARLAGAVPAGLHALAARARVYVEAASSANTRKAYASDWTHFSAWCRRQNLSALPPQPETVGLYITACASGAGQRDAKAHSVATIERRLSAIGWMLQQRGLVFARKDRAIATVLAGIRNTHAAPPRQKDAISAEDLIAMLATLELGNLRGLRDRAMLLIGYAGGLRRSEITGLDVARDQTQDGRGWVEVFDNGLLVVLRGKTGWREVEIGRGSSNATCPLFALESWMTLARLAHGPLFRRITAQGKALGSERLNDREIARLIKRTVLAAGLRKDLPDSQRAALFSGHSLRAGLATYADVDERYVQKHLGHASAEMTRHYQRRRDRFRINLTTAAGL